MLIFLILKSEEEIIHKEIFISLRSLRFILIAKKLLSILTEQNRTKQNKTKQNRTEQNRTEQNRTEQNRTEQNRTE
jgi:hypothetical protein